MRLWLEEIVYATENNPTQVKTPCTIFFLCPILSLCLCRGAQTPLLNSILGLPNERQGIMAFPSSPLWEYTCIFFPRAGGLPRHVPWGLNLHVWLVWKLAKILSLKVSKATFLRTISEILTAWLYSERWLKTAFLHLLSHSDSILHWYSLPVKKKFFLTTSHASSAWDLKLKPWSIWVLHHQEEILQREFS